MKGIIIDNKQKYVYNNLIKVSIKENELIISYVDEDGVFHMEISPIPTSLEVYQYEDC